MNQSPVGDDTLRVGWGQNGGGGGEKSTDGKHLSFCLKKKKDKDMDKSRRSCSRPAFSNLKVVLSFDWS